VVYSKVLSLEFFPVAAVPGITYEIKNPKFKLGDENLAIEVHSNNQTEVDSQLVYKCRDSVKPSLIQIVESLFSIFATFFVRALFGSGVSKTTFEKVVPVDSALCAIGELKEVNGNFSIIADSITQSKELLLRKLKDNLFLNLVFFGVFGCILAKSLVSRKNRKKRNMVLMAQENFEAPQGFECCICLTNIRNVILEPCLHIVVCGSCRESIKECPICRRLIKRTVLVRYSNN